MKSFGNVLLRLKAQTGLQADKEIAELLGISPTAFNDRKRRDAFPEDKLLALATRRPELNLDVDYVLTGNTENAIARAAATIGARIRQVRGETDAADFAAALGIAVDELQRIEQGAKKPSAELLKHLMSSSPNVDPVWLLTGKPRTLEGDLTSHEMVLVANYRASSPEGQALIRRLAVEAADYARAVASSII